MRLNLAQALMCRSDLLLLDEPTNHLDLDAVVWLEGWLRRYQGTLLLISHDREFLDAVVTHVLNIADQKAELFTGDLTGFERKRAERLIQHQIQYEKQQRERAHLQQFVDRFRAQATKARQAQSRIKALERMVDIAPIRAASPISFEFREPKKAAAAVARARRCRRRLRRAARARSHQTESVAGRSHRACSARTAPANRR